MYSEAVTTTRTELLSELPVATWRTRRPWATLALVALGGVVLTAAGSALGVIAELEPASATWVTAGFVALSALVGLAVMLASKRPPAAYGFRSPTQLREVWWAAPLWLAPAMIATISGFHLKPGLLVALVALSIVVGFNEEIWFRGLAMAAIRRLGAKPAVVGSAIVFGLMHLANALAGAPGLALVLQLGFAIVVGIVLAEVLVITRSLWIPIAWHCVYDVVSFHEGGSLSARALVAASLVTLILAGYAVVLWRRLPPSEQD